MWRRASLSETETLRGGMLDRLDVDLRVSLVDARARQRYERDPAQLTGELEACERVWRDYGVTRTVNPSANYVYHTYKIVVIDRDGNLRFDFIGIDDPQKALFSDIEGLLGETP